MIPQTVILFPTTDVVRRAEQVRRAYPDAARIIILCRSAVRPQLDLDFKVEAMGINEFTPETPTRLVVVVDPQMLKDALRKLMRWCRDTQAQIEAVLPTEDGGFESLALVGAD